MILIDTSVWIDHLHRPVRELENLLAAAMILQHPFVTGELALGNLKHRQSVLALLQALPTAAIAPEADFLTFVAHSGLAATGIGFVDAHLLTTCRLAPGTLLWSRDKRLDRWAESLKVAWDPA